MKQIDTALHEYRGTRLWLTLARAPAICLALSAFCTGTASAQVLFSCGASSGYSYYLPGGIIGLDDAQWIEDGISGGGIQLLQDGANFDLIYTDAFGGRSAKADGGQVIGYPADAGFLVIVAYPNVIETYQFNTEVDKVAWTQNKLHPASRKMAAFVADCQ
jgi:hypothetical protein